MDISDSANDLDRLTASSKALLEKSDIESQRHELDQQSRSLTETSAATSVKACYLTVYFLLNIALTLSNKAVLRKASFPWLLTTLHATATSVGCGTLLATGQLNLAKLGLRETFILIAFSLLFTLNIAISNVSLAIVSVPFHQIVRSLCPIVTILIYRTVYSRTYSTATYLSMAPLVLGVSLATVGDYCFTVTGFVLTTLGVLLACIKTVAANRLMTGNLALSPTEILSCMSPLAALQCLCYAFASGEISTLRQITPILDRPLLAALGLNAITAFALNIVSLQTNKLAGALTVSVCGNVKQCLTILLGIVLFDVQIGALNATGMAVTVLGAAWYSKVELDTKRARSLG